MSYFFIETCLPDYLIWKGILNNHYLLSESKRTVSELEQDDDLWFDEFSMY